MNTLLSICFLIVVVTCQISIAVRLDRKSKTHEKWNQRIGRWLFYTFAIFELTSFLLVCFIFILAIFVHKMPLQWEQIHSFGKYQAQLGNPADFSLIIALLGIPFAIASQIFSFKISRFLSTIAIVVFNYFLQMDIVHWLVD